MAETARQKTVGEVQELYADLAPEMDRVCTPAGRILLLEHGRSDVEMLARFQGWRADAHYEKHGCRSDQAPLEVVAGAGLPVR